MAYSNRPPRLLDRLGYELRRFRKLHAPLHWLRRKLWAGVVAGFWEAVRTMFADVPRFGPPGRIVSVYQWLRSGSPPLRGRIILHDQGQPVATEDSLLVRSGLQQHAEQPWPVFWSEHKDVQLVSPSLALVLPGKRLCAESVYHERRWRVDTAARYLRLPRAVRLDGSWTSIVSLWTPAQGPAFYGHWLLDALPRLAVLSEFPPETRIIVPAQLAPYQVETLKMLGVWERCRPTAEVHLEVERYFFSAPTSMVTCYNPYVVDFLRSAFLPHCDPNYTGPRKFFFLRSSKRRSVENNDEVAEFFRKRGWGVVRDMDLNFAQTVKLFSEADAICSTLGSNMCNLAFCQPGCTVMQFVLDGWMDGFVDWIAQTCQLNYHVQVVRCGGEYMKRIRIEPGEIEEFFQRSGVQF
jgi:hypothetical protein